MNNRATEPPKGEEMTDAQQAAIDGIAPDDRRVCVYDMTPAFDVESALHNKLIEMGWKPPSPNEQQEWDYARLREDAKAGWKEAAIAWGVCASIHREWAKGKDAVFNTRQADFVRHAGKARAAMEGGK